MTLASHADGWYHFTGDIIRAIWEARKVKGNNGRVAKCIFGSAIGINIDGFEDVGARNEQEAK